ncbi:hypothetical protein [Nannocystis radixulma]|uniref:Lipoprotein n=1 Tax=Nannocystis radixulma TaxID=2995305 RepID=A0ABT5BKN1_9BACT|nr:hypothetical protein [Nannocystis radixulma]MDC0674694.1 hypothetical protein [Nannocystis radixulma]
MRRLLVAAAAVLLACSGSNSSGPGNPPTTTPASSPAPAESEGAGFAAPPPADEQPRGASSTEVPPELAERIKAKFGDNCRYERACGDLVGVDCNAAVDGPYHYVRRDSLEVVSRCGGACMGGGCTDCPPKAWTCPTY